MRRLREQLRAVAPTDTTVLLVGETGTGKGLVADAIHALSARRAGPMIHVDCAALAPSVIESELFGHERGAFTGAETRRAGRFELASNGTIFLDEIGDLEPRLQAKLLRVLQNRRFERVGGSRALATEARVLAATNRDLESEMRSGRFRPDLFFRLRVFEIQLPALRERLEDLPALVGTQLVELSARLERPFPEIADSFWAQLRTYRWPGNVRELHHLLERLMIDRVGRVWTGSDLEPLWVSSPTSSLPIATQRDFDERERVTLSGQLEQHRWNVSAVARSLGVSRGALRARMARLGLER